MTYDFNFDIAKETFRKRYAECKGKEIDNCKLPAGSPMYYYCRGCCKNVAILPEGWFRKGPPKYCEACKVLAEHGLLDELKKEINM